MPITVQWPLENDRFGPGFSFQGSTDLVGPIPLDWSWIIDLIATGPVETTLATSILTTASQQSFSGVMGYTPDAQGVHRPTNVFPMNPRAMTSGTWRFSARLQRPNGLIEDQTSFPVQLDMTTAQISYLEDTIRSVVGNVQGGFTDQDRADAQIVKMSVSTEYAPSIPGAIPILGTVIEHFLSPSDGLLVEAHPLLLSGRGQLPYVIPPGFITSYGGTWRIVTAPTGLGRHDGVQVRFEHRLVQWRVIRVDAGSRNYVDQVDDQFMSDQRIRWDSPAPLRVEYDIQPGVVLEWQFLLIKAGGPAELGDQVQQNQA